MDFIFVEGTPDRHVRRRMRRHVMLGKNAGKTIHRPSRDERATRPRHPASVPRQVGNALTGLIPMRSTPVSALEITDEFFHLTTERLYPAHLGISVKDARLMWLRMVFADEISYRCHLGLMQACNEIFKSNGHSPKTALFHLADTFHQVQVKLRSEDALGDSSVALIVSLIMQEQIRNQVATAEIHARGLAQMVQLRGGLDGLEDNQELVLRVCKADIMLSLQHGRPPMFFRDRMADVHRTLAPRGLPGDVFDCPVRSLPVEPILLGIYSDVMRICVLLNRAPREPVLEMMVFEEILVSVCYRLLRFRSLNQSQQRADVQSAYHLGLINFMMTTFLQCNRHRILNNRLISTCLRDTLDREWHENGDESTFWLMMCGGLWVSGEADGAWIALRIRELARVLGLVEWDDVRRTVGRFPWIHAVHDDLARKLWEEVWYASSIGHCGQKESRGH
ncbi:hypothetical protein N7492_001892 [Penicillium capsulatum]|uniref:Uncharacterized protein n=1 Tax=Penicillium capsulatum TaxID=69766 RepID=A0A9W9IYQ0_9EURO|nr:hypothetical protein N7492_001892 [Penicillium capsulatum]KAJ6129060.1 hypothetical protein N7512_001840 [Penicillium capsulatum]